MALRTRAISTADGFVPLSGPSFRTRHCIVIGKVRNARSAEKSAPYCVTKSATGSPAAAAAMVSGLTGRATDVEVAGLLAVEAAPAAELGAPAVAIPTVDPTPKLVAESCE